MHWRHAGRGIHCPRLEPESGDMGKPGADTQASKTPIPPPMLSPKPPIVRSDATRHVVRC